MKRFFSFLGSLIFGAGIAWLFYVLYMLAYCCMR